jgi:hypothetical protein
MWVMPIGKGKDSQDRVVNRTLGIPYSHVSARIDFIAIYKSQLQRPET